jgi:hypothetical protein
MGGASLWNACSCVLCWRIPGAPSPSRGRCGWLVYFGGVAVAYISAKSGSESTAHWRGMGTCIGWVLANPSIQPVPYSRCSGRALGRWGVANELEDSRLGEQIGRERF